MLDADMNSRYWAHLSRRYYNWDRYSKIFLAIMSSSTVASWGIWDNVQLLWKLLSTISALTAIAIPFLNWPKMIQRMTLLNEKWTELKNDYEQIWALYRANKIEELEIQKKFKSIKTRENKASKLDHNLPYRKKILRVCMREVIESRGLERKGDLI